MRLTKLRLGFLKFWKLKFQYFFFVFFNMGPYGSQNFKMLLFSQITLESFKLFLNFVSVVRTKLLVCIFEVLSFDISRFFIRFNMSPYGSQSSKRYSSHKSLVNLSHFFLNWRLSSPHKSTVSDF